MSTDSPVLHPHIEPVAFLIGSWTGEGRGFYPTIPDFTYIETITFTATPGKPFLRYLQTTRGEDGAPMHQEAGYLRPDPAGGSVEFTLAQPTGQTELLEGALVVATDGAVTMDMGPSSVRNTGSAKQVDSTRRTYVVNAEQTEVVTRFDMAAVGQPMQEHLESILRKQAP